jgi:exodeoxyribonuclease VII small subunit
MSERKKSVPSKLTFEEALKQLEVLVHRMEAGDVPLAELIETYEKGSELLRTCEGHLEQAETRLLQLKQGQLEMLS